MIKWLTVWHWVSYHCAANEITRASTYERLCRLNKVRGEFQFDTVKSV